VESTINQVIAKRFVKKQQMRWRPRGAHLLLQVRVHALDDDLHTCSPQNSVMSCTGGREEVFVMQAAEDRIGMDGIRFSAAMARIGMRMVDIGEWRIGDTGTKR
jgi:hypothetical protein